MEESKMPTVKQLEDFAHRVHVPFGYLFLPKPPEEKISFPFFRLGTNPKDKPSLNVYDMILLMQKRQDWLSDYLRDNGYDPLPFVGKYNVESDYKEIVEDISIHLDLEENKSFSDWEDRQRYLIQKIEDAGVIVVSNGVVENNTHRSIPVEECRGFVLVDDYAPFLFLNAADAPAAKMFTLIHELAHIWVGKSVGVDLNQMLPADDPIEKLCDKVAAEFLLPEKLFDLAWDQEQDFQKLSKKLKVSPVVLARRALDRNKISKGEFVGIYKGYMAKFSDKKSGGGGNYYATAKTRVSITFAAHIRQALTSGSLLYRDAYKLTGMKGPTFDKFFEKHNMV